MELKNCSELAKALRKVRSGITKLHSLQNDEYWTGQITLFAEVYRQVVKALEADNPSFKEELFFRAVFGEKFDEIEI